MDQSAPFFRLSADALQHIAYFLDGRTTMKLTCIGSVRLTSLLTTQGAVQSLDLVDPTCFPRSLLRFSSLQELYIVTRTKRDNIYFLEGIDFSILPSKLRILHLHVPNALSALHLQLQANLKLKLPEELEDLSFSDQYDPEMDQVALATALPANLQSLTLPPNIIFEPSFPTLLPTNLASLSIKLNSTKLVSEDAKESKPEKLFPSSLTRLSLAVTDAHLPLVFNCIPKTVKHLFVQIVQLIGNHQAAEAWNDPWNGYSRMYFRMLRGHAPVDFWNRIMDIPSVLPPLLETLHLTGAIQLKAVANLPKTLTDLNVVISREGEYRGSDPVYGNFIRRNAAQTEPNDEHPFSDIFAALPLLKRLSSPLPLDASSDSQLPATLREWDGFQLPQDAAYVPKNLTSLSLITLNDSVAQQLPPLLEKLQFGVCETSQAGNKHLRALSRLSSVALEAMAFLDASSNYLKGLAMIRMLPASVTHLKVVLFLVDTDPEWSWPARLRTLELRLLAAVHLPHLFTSLKPLTSLTTAKIVLLKHVREQFTDMSALPRSLEKLKIKCAADYGIALIPPTAFILHDKHLAGLPPFLYHLELFGLLNDFSAEGLHQYLPKTLLRLKLNNRGFAKSFGGALKAMPPNTPINEIYPYHAHLLPKHLVIEDALMAKANEERKLRQFDRLVKACPDVPFSNTKELLKLVPLETDDDDDDEDESPSERSKCTTM